MAQAYSQRPSSLVGIRDERTAFDFDAAVFIRAAKVTKDGPKLTPEQELERLKQQFAAVERMGRS